MKAYQILPISSTVLGRLGSSTACVANRTPARSEGIALVHCKHEDILWQLQRKLIFCQQFPGPVLHLRQEAFDTYGETVPGDYPQRKSERLKPRLNWKKRKTDCFCGKNGLC